MQELLALINEIDNMKDLKIVIEKVKSKQKGWRHLATEQAKLSINVGDTVLCIGSGGDQEAVVKDIRRTKATILIEGRRYTAPLSILKPMEVA